MRSPSKGTVLFPVTAVLLLGACSAGPTDPDATPSPDPAVAAPVFATAGDTVSLELGGSVTFQPMGVEVTFLRLVEDSRCPVGVTCVWEGEAAVDVRVATDDGTSQIRLHTTLEPRAASLGTSVLRLVDVLPYPVDDPLADPARPSILVSLESAAAGS